ncbi:MAG: hypothetical protein QOF00_84 [Pseudonocardiales bacterium]|nr:hypothetical protein [Pseudonocardiales bacterium]
MQGGQYRECRGGGGGGGEACREHRHRTDAVGQPPTDRPHQHREDHEAGDAGGRVLRRQLVGVAEIGGR